jgi:hypothetical protein
MGQRPINEWWNELDPATQQWFTENPGCMILPRTVANVVQDAAGLIVEQDQHGEVELSAGDQDFIRAQAKTAGNPVGGAGLGPAPNAPSPA